MQLLLSFIEIHRNELSDTVDDTDEYDGHAINYERWFKEEEYDDDPYFSIEFDEVTHWCPLPAGPKKCKREDDNV